MQPRVASAAASPSPARPGGSRGTHPGDFLLLNISGQLNINKSGPSRLSRILPPAILLCHPIPAQASFGISPAASVIRSVLTTGRS